MQIGSSSTGSCAKAHIHLREVSWLPPLLISLLIAEVKVEPTSYPGTSHIYSCRSVLPIFRRCLMKILAKISVFKIYASCSCNLTILQSWADALYLYLFWLTMNVFSFCLVQLGIKTKKVWGKRGTCPCDLQMFLPKRALIKCEVFMCFCDAVFVC
jgi:hypothetical protein